MSKIIYTSLHKSHKTYSKTKLLYKLENCKMVHYIILQAQYLTLEHPILY